MLPKIALTALYLPELFSLVSYCYKMFQMVKEIVDQKKKRSNLYTKGSKIYTRKPEINEIPKRKGERIHNIQERLWKRKARAFKEKIFQAYCFNLDQEIFQSLQEVFNQRSFPSQAFIQAFIHLEKIQKGFLHLSKVFLLLYSLI